MTFWMHSTARIAGITLHYWAYIIYPNCLGIEKVFCYFVCNSITAIMLFWSHCVHALLFEHAGSPHPAELSYTRVGGLAQTLGLHRRLSEEEEHLVIIWVLALRNPEGTHELRFWRTERTVRANTGRKEWFSFTRDSNLCQKHPLS